MTRFPSEAEIVDLERSPSGIEFGNRGYDESFLKRMQKCGYLDPMLRRGSSLERLQQLYNANGLVLFLGAGVSKPSGIPEWRELIDAILRSIGFGSPPEKFSSWSRVLEEKAGLSLVSQFDLVSHQSEGPDQSNNFVTLLREHIYGAPQFQRIRELMNSIPENNNAKLKFNWQPLLSELQKNATLAAIGELLIDQNAEPVALNQKIGAVLTTNADNLLQAYVMARAGGRRLLTTVDRASVSEKPETTSVYHLHGWLDVREQRDKEVEMPSLVFRESEYFDTIANSNAFANYTAQSLFQRRNVLFIGSSLEDVNVRRWLYNSFNERRLHLTAFLKARYGDYPGYRAEAYAASIRHFWLKRSGDLPEPAQRIQDSMADAMRHLGVEAVWYREHSEIAEYLRQLSRTPYATG